MDDSALAALDQAAAALIGALQAVEEARRQLRARPQAHDPAGNVKPAPFFLNSAATAAILDERAGPGVVNVPVEPIVLVDQPRRSEDPRLAKANDDGADAPKVQKRTKPAKRGRGSERIEIDAEVWQACLDAYLDPQRFSVSHCIVVAQRLAAAKAVHIPSHETFRNRLRELGLPRPAAPLATGPQRAASAAALPPIPEPVAAEAEPRPVRMQPAIERSAPKSSPVRKRAAEADPDEEEVFEDFQAKLAAARARREAGDTAAIVARPTVDGERIANAYRAKRIAPPPARKPPTRRALDAEGCVYCGIPGTRGCDHFLPFEPEAAHG